MGLTSYTEHGVSVHRRKKCCLRQGTSSQTNLALRQTGVTLQWETSIMLYQTVYEVSLLWKLALCYVKRGSLYSGKLALRQTGLSVQWKLALCYVRQRSRYSQPHLSLQRRLLQNTDDNGPPFPQDINSRTQSML